MNYSGINIEELQMHIGLSEKHTDEVLNKLRVLEYNPILLPLYNLLLLERYNDTVLLIKKAMDIKFDIEYINSLQKSRFWLQRKCIPKISMNSSNEIRKEIFKISLNDNSHNVVRETIDAILLKNPFTESETKQIARKLFDSLITNNRIVAVDILTLFNFEREFLIEILKKNCWRTRFSCIKLLEKFSSENQKLIINELKNDSVDEIRIELAKKLYTLEYIEFLNDTNIYVRSAYLNNVINQINDENLLKDIILKNEWEVSKVFLNIKGDFFKKLTIPLIENNISLVPWRTRLEILNLLVNQLKDELVIKILIDFFIICVKDRVFIIRKRIAEIFCNLIEIYDWMIDYESIFKEIIESTNYLYRLTFVPVIIKFDQKFNKNLSEIIKNDKVKNVKNYFEEILKQNDTN